MTHGYLRRFVLAGLLAVAGPIWAASGHTVENVKTADIAVVQDAFTHGYTHNEIIDTIGGKPYPTLTIQCVNSGAHQPHSDQSKEFFSVWTRDLYWGFLGWSQAGDANVLKRMKTSILALIACKNHNKADGHNKSWPLSDGRHYIPQAWCTGGRIAEDFFPYCSESQADFLLLTHNYWRMTGDTAFIKSIWGDIEYVTNTIELMDTNGNSLPDNLWGSYDYQGLGVDQEEPLMSAKASAAYRAVASLAHEVGKDDEAKRLTDLSERVWRTMNMPVSKGGLWKTDGGYYVNSRRITKGSEGVDDRFIPYENLVPMFLGMTSSTQDKLIFDRLDRGFETYYDSKWGPMYTAPAARTENSVIDHSSTPWLGFLDVYLRCKKRDSKVRSDVFGLLIKHAYDVPAAPISEGAGITGNLTGGAGRSWDNGNFFHCLICGIYGLEKSQAGIQVNAPAKMDGFPLTELKDVRWEEAVYDFSWKGQGSRIGEVLLDGKPCRSNLSAGSYVLHEPTGSHKVTVKLQ